MASTFTRIAQPVERVLADSLQHCVSFAFGIHVYQGLFHQVRQQVEHRARTHVTRRAHGLRGVHAPAASEYREPPKHGALGLGKQFVAPVDQGAQRLLARQCGAVAMREQAEAVAQALGDRLHRQRTYARSSQLDRQRNAVQAAADVDYRRRVAESHLECPAERPSRAR